jgi:hypothetical protein
VALDELSKTTRRRLGFSALFFSGTAIAVFGWMAEFGSYPEDFQIAALIGHFIQLVAVFGLLLTPDEVREAGSEEEKEF